MTKWTAYNIAWSGAFYDARQGKIISYRNSVMQPEGFTAYSDDDEPMFSIPAAILARGHDNYFL